MARLGDICVKITDGSHNPPQGIENSEFLMLSSKNVYDDKITFDEPRYLSEPDFAVEDKRTAINAGDVNVIVGNIKGGSLIQEDGVFYRYKSEYAFKYFYKTNGTTNEYICNDPRLGFQVIVNSTKLTSAINKDSPKPSSLYIETSISYTSANDFDMFSNGSTNTNTVSPKKQIFSLMDML